MTNYIKINEDFDYQKIKQLDIESEKKMVEGPGPADECICHLLADHAPQRGVGGTMRDSFKRAFRSMSGSVKKHHHGGMGGGGGGVGIVPGWGPRERGTGSCVNPECDGSVGKGGGVYVPFTTVKGGKGIYTTKETLKRTKPCGSKCGCDKENIVMKHAYANIKIITPDVSSICPCPNSCIDSEALNSIKVTVEHLQLHPDTSDSEASVSSVPPCSLPEPVIEKRSISDLIDAQYAGTMYEDQEKKLVEQEEDTISEWSFGIPVGEEETEEEEDDEDEKQLPKKPAAKPMGSNHRSLCTVAATSEAKDSSAEVEEAVLPKHMESKRLDNNVNTIPPKPIESKVLDDNVNVIPPKHIESKRLDNNFNVIPPKHIESNRFDKNVNVISPKHIESNRFDNNVNVIPPKPIESEKLDNNGNAIPTKQKESKKLDDNPNAIPPKHNEPKTLDSNPNAIPPKHNEPKTLDSDANAIPLKHIEPKTIDGNANAIPKKYTKSKRLFGNSNTCETQTMNSKKWRPRS